MVICLISLLQIQSTLLDVGANIATPMSSARESHISIYLKTRVVAVVIFCNNMHLLFILSQGGQDLLPSQS